MIACARFPCGGHAGGCSFADCINNQPRGMPFPNFPAPSFIAPTPSPRYLPVNIPFSLFGITVVTLDGHGNVEIKVDQPYPVAPADRGTKA